MPTPSILSGTTVHGRRSSFKFLSDAASVLTQSRRKHTNRISTLIGSAPAPSHNRALKLVVHLSAAHALRHGHDVTHTANVLVSLITVCHDVCSRCRTPHLDVLDEAICQEVDRHLVGLVDDLRCESYDSPALPIDAMMRSVHPRSPTVSGLHATSASFTRPIHSSRRVSSLSTS
jgi:hypothetical protein